MTLASLDFPEWVLNWDFEVGSDPDGVPAVWVTLYADENSIPPDQFGKGALEMIPKLRSALTAAGFRRWPYIRMRTALEHRLGPGSANHGTSRPLVGPGDSPSGPLRSDSPGSRSHWGSAVPTAASAPPVAAPCEADLRCAISTAYYALFTCLSTPRQRVAWQPWPCALRGEELRARADDEDLHEVYRLGGR